MSRKTRLLLATVLAGALILPASAMAGNPDNALGVYAGSGMPTYVAAFEEKLGSNVAYVHDTLPRSNWDDLIDAEWFVNQWKGTRYEANVVFTVPMLPDNGGTLAQGADGDFDHYFKTLAERMVAGGQGSATLRLGPEFNGSWFRWSIKANNGARDYAAYWRHIVDAMRSVDGADFKFDWCPNGGSSYVDGKPLQAASAYPGDNYVDYIGLDVYDQSWAEDRNDPEKRWLGYVNAPDGLAWHRDFAARHNKPMTFPEWGLAARSDEFGGGDDVTFIEKMYDWIAANNVKYALYFDFSDGTTDSKLFDDTFPNATRRFVELFGPGDVPPTSTGDGTGSTDGPVAHTSVENTARPKSTGKKNKAARRKRARKAKAHVAVPRRSGKVVMAARWTAASARAHH